MTQEQIDFVRACVRDGRVNEFYAWGKWKELRREILRQDKGECQECKKLGKYRRAVIVHHVKHLRIHPELALCKTYITPEGKEERQLISVCRECHESVCHPERMRKRRDKEKFWTEEKW